MTYFSPMGAGPSILYAKTAAPTYATAAPKVGTASSVVVPEGTITEVEVSPGVFSRYVMQGGRQIFLNQRKTDRRKACEAAGPAQTWDDCTHMTGDAVGTFGRHWAECVGSGMPAELVPQCYAETLKRNITGSRAAVDLAAKFEAGMQTEQAAQAQAAQQAQVAAEQSSKKQMLIYGAVALGVVGLVYFLRRRKS